MCKLCNNRDVFLLRSKLIIGLKLGVNRIRLEIISGVEPKTDLVVNFDLTRTTRGPVIIAGLCNRIPGSLSRNISRLCPDCRRTRVRKTTAIAGSHSIRVLDNMGIYASELRTNYEYKAYAYRNARG